MNELTSNDINQIIEALQVWEKEPTSHELQGSMFGMMLAGISAKTPDEAEQQRYEAKRKSDIAMERANNSCKLRREQSVILQAKLLQMRNEALKAELV